MSWTELCKLIIEDSKPVLERLSLYRKCTSDLNEILAKRHNDEIDCDEAIKQLDKKWKQLCLALSEQGEPK